LTYFDEVKPQGEAQPYYWLGGLMVDSDAVIVVDAELAALAEACFGEGCGLRRDQGRQRRGGSVAVARG
jgi:hypothetical protein